MTSLDNRQPDRNRKQRANIPEGNARYGQRTGVLALGSWSFANTDTPWIFLSLFSNKCQSWLQVLATLEEIQERHDAVKEIEKKLLDLHQVYLHKETKTWNINIV